LPLAMMGSFSLYNKYIARKNMNSKSQRDLSERPSVQA